VSAVGADIHAGKDFAARWAASGGHLDVLQFLVGCGADIRACDDDAVRSACLNGHFEVVKYLVSLGANTRSDTYFAIKNAKTKEIYDYLIRINPELQVKEELIKYPNIRFKFI
jgi:hypothetical protein